MIVSGKPASILGSSPRTGFFGIMLWRQRRNAPLTITKEESALMPINCAAAGLHAALHANEPTSPHHAAAFSWLKHPGSRRQGFTLSLHHLQLAPASSALGD